MKQDAQQGIKGSGTMMLSGKLIEFPCGASWASLNTLMCYDIWQKFSGDLTYKSSSYKPTTTHKYSGNKFVINEATSDLSLTITG